MNKRDVDEEIGIAYQVLRDNQKIVKDGKISSSRYESYVLLHEELKEAEKHRF